MLDFGQIIKSNNQIKRLVHPYPAPSRCSLQVLSNPETRRQYDAEAGLARPPAPSRGARGGAAPGRAMRGTFRNGGQPLTPSHP